MYSEKVIQRNIAELYNTTGLSLIRYDNAYVDDMVAKLDELVAEVDDYGNVKKWRREPTAAETEFITNERLMCKLDFRYYATRYCHIKHAAVAGEVPLVKRMGEFMPTQEVLLDLLAECEEEQYDMFDQGYPAPGIWVVNHKARQTGYTAFWRMALSHRVLFNMDTPSLSASVDEQMVHELYDRDQVLYSRLPFWLRPKISADVKDRHMEFDGLHSGTYYAQANQKGGMGTGKTTGIIHLTECALWEHMTGNPRKIDFDLLPGIPRAINTLVALESTAAGVGGYWYTLVNRCLEGKGGEFRLLFCPWYLADKKYVKQPPIGWEPLTETVAMAQMVERTSHKYTGKTVRLTAQQAYYWEFNYTYAKNNRTLNLFLSNYPTTVEESFQHSGDAAFSVETLNLLRSRTGRLYGAYDLV